MRSIELINTRKGTHYGHCDLYFLLVKSSVIFRLKALRKMDEMSVIVEVKMDIHVSLQIALKITKMIQNIYFYEPVIILCHYAVKL